MSKKWRIFFLRSKLRRLSNKCGEDVDVEEIEKTVQELEKLVGFAKEDEIKDTTEFKADYNNWQKKKKGVSQFRNLYRLGKVFAVLLVGTFLFLFLSEKPIAGQKKSFFDWIEVKNNTLDYIQYAKKIEWQYEEKADTEEQLIDPEKEIVYDGLTKCSDRVKMLLTDKLPKEYSAYRITVLGKPPEEQIYLDLVSKDGKKTGTMECHNFSYRGNYVGTFYVQGELLEQSSINGRDYCIYQCEEDILGIVFIENTEYDFKLKCTKEEMKEFIENLK